jgi:outer membrane protein assembly factor BamD (BamD/ComL family)
MMTLETMADSRTDGVSKMIEALRTPRRTLTSALLSFAIAAPVLAQDATKDNVPLKDGKTESGKIKSEDYGGLVIDNRGDKTLLWPDIRAEGITYAGALAYQSAKEKFDAGNLDEALSAFDELKGDKKLRPVLMQHTLYFDAFIKQRQGKYDEALAGYKDLLTAFPKSRYLLDVGEHMVQAYIAKKDVAGAAKALDQLSGDALTAGIEPGFSSAVNVLKGRVLEEQKKWSEAQAAYAIAEKAAGVSPTVVAQAVLGQARCAVALGKKSDAETMYRKIVSQDGPSVVMSGAWNGLGDLIIEDTLKAPKADPEKILDGLYCYLRGVVQYSPLPGEPTNEYERALAGAAKAFDYLAQLEAKPENKQVYKQRSLERTAQLRKEFPNSPYLQGK